MDSKIEQSPLPQSPEWIWADQQHPNQTLLFRTHIPDLGDYDSVVVQLTCQTRYFLTANGEYVAQGPCPSIWPDSTVDSHPVTPKDGRISLALIVHYYGVRTQSHPYAPAGLFCRLIGRRGNQWTPIELPASQWKYCDQHGWLSTDLRRTWATGWMEQFDSGRHPQGWEEPGYDDHHWPSAVAVDRVGSTLSRRITPRLEETSLPARRLLAAAQVPIDAPIRDKGEGQLAKLLDTEPWSDLEVGPLQASWDRGEGITASPETGGLALLFDLGEEVVGQTEFTVDAESGIVDHYGAELLRDGRPWAFRGNAEYATRWWASGKNPRFRTLNYNGFRYLLIVLRPHQDPMRLDAFGVWRRQADIRPAVEYQSDDPELQRLWDVSIRTLEVSTQETNVDCPTREQALFIADGLWNALWIDRLFGEPAIFEHYLQIIKRTQHENGLMPSAVFSSLDPPHYLLDFCLIAVWGIDVFRRLHPERSDVVERMMPVAERALGWYQDRIGPSGLIETDPIGIDNRPGGRFEVTFIDHPTIWHTFSHPGIERSRIQLGLNAYLILAVDAFKACAKATGYRHSLDMDRLDTDRLRRTCHKQFWQADRQYYADCYDEEEKQLKGWSAQTQALAVLAGIPAGEEAHSLMGRLAREWKNPDICRCTPYFWVYFAEALIVSGHADKVMPLIRDAWSVMTDDPDTTTWWETFEGSDRDTRCHPWSSLPAWVLSGEAADFRLCPE